VVFRTPPRVVSGIRGGGGGGGSESHGDDMCPSGNHFSRTPPPPSLKLGWTGGPKKFTDVDFNFLGCVKYGGD
jgi:hypothetical protein